MNGKKTVDESRISIVADGSERRCEGCSRSHSGINLEKRCGTCVDEGRDFIAKACEACGGGQRLDMLMRAHDAEFHPDIPRPGGAPGPGIGCRSVHYRPRAR